MRAFVLLVIQHLRCVLNSNCLRWLDCIIEEKSYFISSAIVKQIGRCNALENLESSDTQVMWGTTKRDIVLEDIFHTCNVFFVLLFALPVYYLSEGFKAHWFTTLAKDSRHTGLLP